MYAIVKTGGKQYRVQRGQTLLVERLPAQEGASVELAPILYRSEEAVFDRAGLEKVKVTARVVAHERGEKLRVFKFKPKRGYKRRTGHRQELTRIEVTDISVGAAAKGPAAKTAARPVAARPHAEPASPKRAPTKAQAKPRAKPAAKPAAGEASSKPKAKPAAAPRAAKRAARKEEPDGS